MKQTGRPYPYLMRDWTVDILKTPEHTKGTELGAAPS